MANSGENRRAGGCSHTTFKAQMISFVRKPIRALWARTREYRRWFTRLINPPELPNISQAQRYGLHYNIIKTSYRFRQEQGRKATEKKAPHKDAQIYTFVQEILALPSDVPGVIVEAGTYKGVSAAKFSHAVKMAGRRLYLFDSFQGLPPNEEAHTRSIKGHSIEGWFQSGNFRGSLEEVEHNLRRFGRREVCTLVPGWFEDTLPKFKEAVAAFYLDVDLAESTRTCLKYIYPLVSPGGVLVSQDGDFPLVIDVFSDDRFWEEEVGVERPLIEGLGTSKMLRIRKVT